eukprot:TRINITY_DN9516_c0_g1_i1.p1 TRINITY_DN9516_c0_g1~~TRINITY_DN9516_c0_g1_i1.p1  ORF type:complete len:408 (+),score=71.52 TRINITY_DN9516_c0_g1_i1:77-1300(+)
MQKSQSALISPNFIVHPDQDGTKIGKAASFNKQYLTPKETMDFLGDLGIAKANYSLGKMLILSFQAGMFKSIAAYVGLMIAMGSPELTDGNPGLRRFLFAWAFPVGLILVNIYGAELFTGSVLVLPPSYLVGKISFKKMCKSLSVVFCGNFLGALFVAYFLGHLSGLPSDEPWKSGIIKFIEYKAQIGFGKFFLRGIGCNFMICLGTYGAMSALDITGKVMALYLPSFTFSAIGFEHSIANMFLMPLGLLEGADVSAKAFLVDSIIATAIGNAVGGGIFVGLAAWAVHADVNVLMYRLRKMLHLDVDKNVDKAVHMEMGEVNTPSSVNHSNNIGRNRAPAANPRPATDLYCTPHNALNLDQFGRPFTLNSPMALEGIYSSPQEPDSVVHNMSPPKLEVYDVLSSPTF